MKKKIWFFNKDLKIGGVERQLYYLLNGLDKSRYDTGLLLCKKEGAFLDRIAERVGIRDLGTSYSGTGNIIIAIKLVFFLFKERPDIFVSFHVHLNILSIIACRLLSITVFACFPGYCPESRLYWLRRYFYSWADKLISVSKGVRSSLIKNMRLHDISRNIVIENCVDLKETRERSGEETDGQFFDGERFTIASVGRLCTEKNFGLLIRAAEILPTDCLFLVIGDGEERESLEETARRYGVSDRVKFIGPRLNPYAYIKKASVYLLSSDSEGLPTVLLEAMSLGVPCISSDYHGRTDDLIEHKVTGYVFPRNDHRKLAEAVNFFRDTENSEEIKAIAKNAKRDVMNYSVEKYALKYERLFEEY